MEQPKNPLVAHAFKKYLLETNISGVRIACILGFTLVPLFSLLDYFTVSQHFRTFLFIRLICSSVISLFFLFSFTRIGKRNINLLGAATAVLIGITISLMIRHDGGYESPYYAGLNLVILGITFLFVWDLKQMAAVCLIIYGSYIIPILLYDRIERPEILINNNAFLLATIIIALTSAYFLARLRYREFESRYQLEASRRALQESNEKLKRLGERKNQFFADISHELKTPLAVIRGEAEVTLRGQEKSAVEYKNVLGYIIQVTDQLSKLISDLLFLARSEAGALKIEKKEVSLQKILGRAFREGESLAQEKEILLTQGTYPDRELFLEGDPQRLNQLFLIIIDNAINYSKPGGEVTVLLEREGDWGKVIISDRGIGIPEEALPHVFERFYRVERSRSMAHAGAGLGLPIAKWIAEAHGGKIAIASTVGAGTTVTVFLPIQK